MSPENRITRCHRWVRRTGVAALLLILTLTDSRVSSRQDEKAAESPNPAKGENNTAAVVTAQCIDGSTLKLMVLDERIELDTPYGTLRIPVRDIERIEVAFRIPEEEARRIAAALADLGKEDFARREAASATLVELRERAYPTLEKALKSRDAEVVRRARELLEKIRNEVPEERLQFRPHDVVYTADSKNTGRISSATLKVRTSQFGEQQLKWSDVFEVRSSSASEAEAANALPDPGPLSTSTFIGHIGQVFTFRVTGGVAGGTIWGTDVYTLDSTLAMAAVHAGVLKPGQTGIVRVKILGQQPGFVASTRHGLTSQPYGPYNGSFEFVRGRGRAHR